MQKSTLLHLRFPFSFFLLPVFLFALSVNVPNDWWNALITFVLLHLLLYPASNGYNSYFDKDEHSIGGLKSPPKVTKELYHTALILDMIGLITASIFISWIFAFMFIIYGLVSKAYSHPAIRLKKFPILGWLSIFVFQGYFTFLMALIGIHGYELSEVFVIELQLPALLTSLLLGGSYPMTQIYQHEEDGQRGDQTISRSLGILGTFHFTAAWFLVATVGFAYYFHQYLDMKYFFAFQIFLAPVLVFFLSWYFKVRKDINRANYESTMKLNLISSLMLNLFFVGQIILQFIPG